MQNGWWLVLATLVWPAVLSAAHAPVDPAVRAFYVAMDGDDAHTGTLEQPFATLERARDAVRAAKAQAGFTVYVRGGEYYLGKTFELGQEDSGAEGAPVTYRGHAGERVRLIGGREVDGFTPVDDASVLARIPEAAHGKVLQADLRAQGVTDFGNLSPRGFGRGGASGLELFFQDKPMTLARWPNDDWTHIAEEPKDHQDDRFHYDGDRPERWINADDVWLHGYWTQDWADTYVKVARIDTENKVVHTLEPHGAYGYTPGKRYYALNLLEELDAPGEWYLDRGAGQLYFWPPAAVDQGKAVVSTIGTLVSLSDASYVTVAGFTLECCRSTAVTISGGAHNLLAGCTIRNTGGRGANVSGGAHHGIHGCDVYDTGDGGIGLNGGDRNTLTPGHHFAVNNHIYRYSRVCRTYRPAVMVHGVGLRVAHNLIHDAPHNAIQLGGNDNLIEFNEIHHVCQETGDVGAYYMGRDWTTRGNVIRHNYFHDIHGPYTHGAMAVYLDDAASGTTIFGNVFVRASRAAFIGGGRDNVVENNVFVDCHPGVHIDSRCLGWAKKYAVPGGSWKMYEKLEAVRHDQPPYSERYPKLANILDDEPPVPKGNVIVRNVFSGGDHFNLSAEGREHGTIEHDFTEGDPGFVDAEKGNYQLKDDSPVYAQVPGFQKIPFGEIGLQDDEYRHVLPAPTEPR